jgi:hypothetical protein
MHCSIKLKRTSFLILPGAPTIKLYYQFPLYANAAAVAGFCPLWGADLEVTKSGGPGALKALGWTQVSRCAERRSTAVRRTGRQPASVSAWQVCLIPTGGTTLRLKR